MSNSIRIIFSFIISTLPFNRLRIFLFRIFFKYDIDYKSKIGMFNIINCTNLKMRTAKIGFLNQIIVNKLTLEDKASILKMNRIKNINILSLKFNTEIRSGNFIGAPVKGTVDDAIKYSNQNIYVAENSSILRNNYFDVVEEIIIGKNVVFGGNGSEIWTHGFTVNRKMLVGKVIFENDIFIGSNCIFTKGISVLSETTITPGSVIYKDVTEKGIYSTHQIRKVK